MIAHLQFDTRNLTSRAGEDRQYNTASTHQYPQILDWYRTGGPTLAALYWTGNASPFTWEMIQYILTVGIFIS